MQEIIINQDKEKNKIVALVENGKLVEKYEEKINYTWTEPGNGAVSGSMWRKF